MNYKIEKLKDVADIIRGVSFSKDEATTSEKENTLPIIRAGSIQKELLINYENLWIAQDKVKLHQIIKKDDIIMCTSSGSADLVGKTARATTDWKGSFGAFCTGIRPKIGKCNASFLFHFLQSPTFRNWTQLSSGANIKNIRVSELGDFKVQFPDLPTQTKIAQILDKADQIRQKRKKAIELVDEFLKSLFLEMFGDPVVNSKQLPLVKLSNIGSLDRGKSKHRPRNDPILLGGVHPLIQTGDVANCNGYITHYSSTYSDIGLAQSKKWKKGTLCITIAANIAKTGILQFDACFPDSIVGFQPNKKLVTTEYIRFLFTFLQKILEKNAPESAQKNINLSILKELELPLPNLDKQEKFSEICGKVYEIINKLDKHNNKLNELFNSLSQQYFTKEE
ncbi:restriction endonuclease subunit S [Mannheimia indoligenes]|uniref:restriction endonuclease subunit S n=1 Tax=Mannheimia indoligenes TaxID=3103145 RepID=UPI002FE522A3